MEVTKSSGPSVKRAVQRPREHAGCNLVNVVQATPNAGVDPPFTRGKLILMDEYERTSSISSAGVVTTTCMHRKAYGTRETPAVEPEDRKQTSNSREPDWAVRGGGEVRSTDESG